MVPRVGRAQENIVESGGEGGITEVVADAGHHGYETIYQVAQAGLRTYIPEVRV